MSKQIKSNRVNRVFRPLLGMLVLVGICFIVFNVINISGTNIRSMQNSKKAAVALSSLQKSFEAAGFETNSNSDVPTDFLAPDRDYFTLYFPQDLTISFQGYSNADGGSSTNFEIDAFRIKDILSNNGLAPSKGSLKPELGAIAYYKNEYMICEVDPRSFVSHVDCNLNTTLDSVYSDIETAALILPTNVPIKKDGQITFSSDKKVRGLLMHDNNGLPHFFVKIGQSDWKYVAGSRGGSSEAPIGPPCSILENFEYKSVFKKYRSSGECEK